MSNPQQGNNIQKNNNNNVDPTSPVSTSSLVSFDDSLTFSIPQQQSQIIRKMRREKQQQGIDTSLASTSSHVSIGDSLTLSNSQKFSGSQNPQSQSQNQQSQIIRENSQKE